MTEVMTSGNVTSDARLNAPVGPSLTPRKTWLGIRFKEVACALLQYHTMGLPLPIAIVEELGALLLDKDLEKSP